MIADAVARRKTTGRFGLDQTRGTSQERPFVVT
jgi:hypothetical protein